MTFFASSARRGWIWPVVVLLLLLRLTNILRLRPSPSTRMIQRTAITTIIIITAQEKHTHESSGMTAVPYMTWVGHIMTMQRVEIVNKVVVVIWQTVVHGYIVVFDGVIAHPTASSEFNRWNQYGSYVHWTIPVARLNSANGRENEMNYCYNDPFGLGIGLDDKIMG